MIIRAFPRRTRATPDDAAVRIGYPGIEDTGIEIERVDISVAFSWDLPKAEMMAAAWSRFAPTRIGGPYYGSTGAFVPGQYVKHGYVITSRGCRNRCWFCDVWRKEGREIVELRVTEGHNVLDANLLQCSQTHRHEVYEMLARQREPIEFTGGFEAAKLTGWDVNWLHRLQPKTVFFAYDTAEDEEPLRAASRMFNSWFIVGHHLHAYCLVGYPGDTFAAAEKRLGTICDCGMMPMAMLYRDKTGKRDPTWTHFARTWTRPQIVGTKMRAEREE